MTDFVDDLEAELLKAARRRAHGRRRLGLRVPVRPALVLAVALAAFVFVVRGGAPEPERQVTKPRCPPRRACPSPPPPRRASRAPRAQPAPDGGTDDIALLRRPRTAADAVDGSRLPIATYDPERTRRVGELGVVADRRPCSTAPRARTRASGPASPTAPNAARCFTIDEVRAGKAFALVEDRTARG